VYKRQNLSRITKKANKEAKDEEKRMEDSLKSGLKRIKEEAQEIINVFKAAGQASDLLGRVFISASDAKMEALKRERDYILNSENLTKEQQEKRIKDIEAKEIEAQKRRIKLERDFFTLKQSLLIAEEIMKVKMDLQSQARKMGIALSDIGTAAAVQAGKAKMSIGQFAAEGGLKGLAAYAISIGGMLAAIISARKKAKDQLSSLGPVSGSMGGGGGTSVSAPDFNVVGASPESQLAQTVQSQQQKPLRAFVVHKDIKNASELDRNITETSALG